MIKQCAEADEGSTSGDVTDSFPLRTRTPVVVAIEVVVIVSVAFIIVVIVVAVPGLFLHELGDKRFELGDLGFRILLGILGGFLGCFGFLGVLILSDRFIFL